MHFCCRPNYSKHRSIRRGARQNSVSQKNSFLGFTPNPKGSLKKDFLEVSFRGFRGKKEFCSTPH